MPAKYDILRTLEEDSASMLYLARDRKSGAEYCMRRFRTRKPEEIDGLKELFAQLSGVDSPHLDLLVDFGTDKEGFYTITAVQEGETLEQALHRGPLTADELEVVTLQLLDVIDQLHEQTIVHGAIRPDYVRITGTSRKDWKVILGGFGQGFAVREDTKEAQIRAYRCTAPEQWQDGTTRRRTDVYALGCVLYEALAARPPFDGRALKELRLKHIGHDLAPLTKLASHVPAWMCAWVMHLLAADPEQRPRKAAAARELFEKREAPPQAEAPRVEPPAPTAAPQPAVPPLVTVAPASAPVVLPASHPMMRNVTSSTIPISTGPRVAGRAVAGTGPKRHTAPSIPKPRRALTMAQPSKKAAAAKKSLMPQALIGITVLALLGLFGLSRCAAKQAEAKTPPAAAKKKK